MKIAYFDCFSGASGDMILGALLDAGLSLDRLKAEVGKLALAHYDIEARTVLKRGIAGSQAVVVIEEHPHTHRRLRHIEEIIGGSSLAEPVKQRSLDIFRRLAQAEARAHRIDVEQVHFHEVGAMDAIIDVVGAVAGLEALGIEKAYCSPLHVGSGAVECAHGLLPAPAPAVVELVKGKPIYSTGAPGELLTPTGAAILTTLASDFGPLPPMTLESVGYGAGSSDPPMPNLLRLLIGERTDEPCGYEAEQVAVLETCIDDMNPQIYDYLIEKMLKEGALDIFLAPVQMKKNRPGALLTAVCRPSSVNALADSLMRETTSIGIRWKVENRLVAQRSISEVETLYGPVRFKIARAKSGVVNVMPEYEDCKRIALERNVPLKEVMDKVKAAISLKTPEAF